LYADLKAGKVHPAAGDAAAWVTYPAAPADQQPRLVRAGGRWRLDLGSVPEYVDEAETPALRAAAAAAAALTRDVRAGRFDTVAAAAAAVEDRLSSAEDAAVAKPAVPAATAPAGVPAPRP